MENKLAPVVDQGQLQKVVVQPLLASFYRTGILETIGN